MANYTDKLTDVPEECGKEERLSNQRDAGEEVVPPYRTENTERERSLFLRIKRLESLDTYINLPQTRPGGYLSLVKDQLDRALGKRVYEAPHIARNLIRDLSIREIQQEAQDSHL